ncbi:DUF6359 domain-containing protein [Paenibacillus sp. CAA11]|uniref:DUF6359 domain-containing protein n=1 Tax=Paenibacillus sp. CAA11 TaxID=1532905 RepID=UPI001F3E77CC|nr:DUF6359 domain-containing protein [Paenibacillus sp. CAA11]
MKVKWSKKAFGWLLGSVLAVTGAVGPIPQQAHAAEDSISEAAVYQLLQTATADRQTLTVEQAIAAGNNGSSVQVEGYVVGHATGSKTANFKAPFANDYNLLLADQAEETDASKLINIQIPAALRNQFGLASHPELVGQKITADGARLVYNNFAGLKNVTSISLSDPGEEPGPGTGNPNPGTGNPDPGTGNPDPGTGNPDPGTGNPDPGTGNPDPGTGNPDPGTGNPEPGTGNPAPGTSPDLPDGSGKKVLFDNTHAQTAGAADWVIDGAFSDFADGLRADGFTVEPLDRQIPYTFGEQAITYEKLKDYDVFVIAEANVPLKQSEQDALLQYVDQGGGVFFISDHYNADRNKNRWDASEVFNGYRRGAFDNPAKGMSAEEAASPAMQGLSSGDWLADNFGVRFRYNAIGDIDANSVVAPSQAFGITEGVQSVAVHAGSTLAVLDPAKAKGIVYVPENPPAWGNAVDSGVYNGGGRAEGPFAAVAKRGLGKAAFIGDSSPVEDASPNYLREENGQTKKTYDGFKEADDAKFLVQTVEWLAHREDYTSLADVPGLSLDTPTALLSSEEPAASTEPQKEPWAQPAPGYKWYDPSTFKPGSYGSGKKPDVQATYGFVHQAQLPSAEEFSIRLTADGMQPGQTVQDLKVGIYVTGGDQIARFKQEDGSWSPYGYSPAFSLTANTAGHAAKELTVQLKPGTTGDATLRLKQGSANLITKSVTVANVPVEPLPDDRPQVPAAVPVAEARGAADGTVVTVEGVVTSEPGLFGGQGFYLQDDTAGIYVYPQAADFHAGDRVTVSASKTVYNGEVELENPVWIEKKGIATVPEPKVQTELNETNQGQLVQLQNVTIRSYKTASPAGSFEFDVVSQDGSSVHVRIDGRTGISYDAFRSDFPEGTAVNIAGISSIFKGIYQLKPLTLAHVAMSTNDAVAPVTTITVKGKTGSEVFNTGNVGIAFWADDEGSGVERTEYRLNEGPWQPAEQGFTLSQDGRFTLDYRSVDQAGNVEEFKRVQINIDKLPPVIQLTGSVRVSQIDSTLPLKVEASDSVSGIQKVTYLLDGLPVAGLERVEPIQLPAGKHILTVWARDGAGRAAKASYVLESVIEVDQLDELVDLAKSKKWISKQGTLNNLQAKIAQLQKAEGSKLFNLRLKALRAEVLLHTGSSISPGFSALMLGDLYHIEKVA